MGGPRTGHDRHARHSAAMFRDKFLVDADFHHSGGCLVGRRPALARLQCPSFPGSKWIPAIFGTGVFAYGGSVFLHGARGELADRKPGMMTLISLGILVAFGASLASTFGLFEV